LFRDLSLSKGWKEVVASQCGVCKKRLLLVMNEDAEREGGGVLDGEGTYSQVREVEFTARGGEIEVERTSRLRLT
jgi:hypothetical protein